MADLSALEKRLAEIEKQQRGLNTKKQQIKSQLSAEKRKKENHCKMVLGGAVFGYVKEDLPEDRKDLEVYGWAVKAAIEEFGDEFIEAIQRHYNRLQIEQDEAAFKEAEGIEENE